MLGTPDLDTLYETVPRPVPQVLNRLSTHTLILRGQTGPGGLIKPLTVNDLVKAIFRQYKIDLDASSLDLNAPINKLGETLVPIYVNPEFSDGNYMLKVCRVWI